MWTFEHNISIWIIYPFINISLILVPGTSQCEIACISLRKTWNTTPCHRGIGHHCLHGHRFLAHSLTREPFPFMALVLKIVQIPKLSYVASIFCREKLSNQYWIRKEHKHDTLQSMWVFWYALCLIIDPFIIAIISFINLKMILGGFYHWRRPQFGQLFPMLTWSTPAGWIQFSLSLFFTFTINNQLFPMLIWNTPAGWIRFSLSLFFTFPFS